MSAKIFCERSVHPLLEPKVEIIILSEYHFKKHVSYFLKAISSENVDTD